MKEAERKRHPIQVAARRAGLTPDLLRAWETRYEAVRPGRSPGGHRRYSDRDVERLELLRQATEAGRRIGDVASLEDDELRELVREDRLHEAIVPGDGPRSEVVEELLAECLRAAGEYDELGLHAALSRASAVLPPEEMVDRVIGPFMRRIGEMWREGRIDPGQEHVATVRVRNVLSNLIFGLSYSTEPNPRMVVGTPKGELHEIGALLAVATAAASGWAVTYLGPDLPAGSLARAAAERDARAVALSVVHPSDPEVGGEEIAELRRGLDDDVPLYLGGKAALERRSAFEAVGARVLDDVRSLGRVLPRSAERA
ncbi:MAG: MerR family transcriptional regulator [Gemmatimonadota bacterium]|nr:MerR family transcriptional regulator [Gemmatimonadota bacterium]